MHLRIAILGISLLWVTASRANELIVTPAAAGEPVIAKAIQSAREGDTVRIKKGVYRETIVLSKRLELVGEAGAVVDPSEPFQAAWQPATEIGPGVYRASSPRKPASLFFEAKVLAELDFRRANKEGPWHWKQLLASGPPRGGFRFIRALWMYHPSEKALYLHLPDNAAPAEARLGVVWTREAVITLRNATEASVRGLTLAHGANGI
ncbi:MAG TPA: hypothetical protein VNZ22_02170, partial [Bacillota bacterium]|nr:hypothetical protein [Bacillota bacterium]